MSRISPKVIFCGRSVICAIRAATIRRSRRLLTSRPIRHAARNTRLLARRPDGILITPFEQGEIEPRRQAVNNRASGTTTGSSLWRIVMPHFAKASAAETGSVATVGLNGTLIPSALRLVTIM